MNKKICLIIPGIGGSKIYCACNSKIKPIKLYPKLIGNLNNHFFEDSKCTVITKPVKTLYTVSVYKNLENRIEDHKIEYYAYDWRKNPLQIANELRNYLIERKKQNTIEAINLIGHSNGGYIIRILIEYLLYPRDHINYVFVCGTPFYGSSDKSLYYNEIKTYRKLHDNNLEAPIKLMCLSGGDVNKIFSIYKETLIYFIPSFVFCEQTTSNISNYTDVPETSVVIVKAIHHILGKFNIEKCIFYFNISKKKSIYRLVEEYELKNIYFNAVPRAIAMKRVKNRFYLKELMYSDNLIVPSISFPRNSIFIFDNIKLNHGLIMNSLFLTHVINIILRSGFNTIATNNNILNEF